MAADPRNMDFEAARAWLEPVLTGSIPLGGAMGLAVARLDSDGIELALPLAPNVNDKGTAFGGALASAMILAGWALPRLLIRQAGVPAELVIGRCQIRFLEPVRDPFRARCAWPGADACQDFLDGLENGGKGRLELAAEIVNDDRVAARLEARYAGLRAAGPDHSRGENR